MDYKRKRRLIIGTSLILLLIFYLFKNISTSLRVFSFIFGLVIFYLADHMFEIEYKLRHYLYIIIILIFGFLFSPLFFISPNYDKILHLVSPFLGCLLVFHIVDKKDLTLQWKLLIVFMFSVSFLTLHEIGEYLADFSWDLKLQGVYIRDITGMEKFNVIMSQIDDTMVDLILGTISTLTFISGKTISYFYNKSKHN